MNWSEPNKTEEHWNKKSEILPTLILASILNRVSLAELKIIYGLNILDETPLYQSELTNCNTAVAVFCLFFDHFSKDTFQILF